MKERLCAGSSIVGMLVIQFIAGIVWNYLKKINRFASVGSNMDMLYFILAIMGTVILMIVFHVCFNKIRLFQNISIHEIGKRELILEIITYLLIAYTHVKVFLNTMNVADAGSFYMPWHSSFVIELAVILLFVVCVLECRLILQKGQLILQKNIINPMVSFFGWTINIFVISG